MKWQWEGLCVTEGVRAWGAVSTIYPCFNRNV